MKLFCKLLLAILLLALTAFLVQASPKKGLIIKAKETNYDAHSNIITASGNVFIQMDEYTLYAAMVHYDLNRDIVYAEGRLRIIDKEGRAIYGEKAVFKDKFKKAIIEEFIAKLDNSSVIVSRTTKRIDKNKVILEKSVFTPCQFNCNKDPIWQLRSGKTDIDYDKQKITYKHLFFEVYGVPLAYLPYFSHPLPNAKAQSGILGPEIKNNDFLIPFYFRPKPNIDATISPRLSNNYTIFETEFRHKVKNGYYDIIGSFGNPPISKRGDKKNATGSEPGRYHVFAKGSFTKDDMNFGFDIRKASDKAYLTNYQEIFDSYLTSKIYANTIATRNYFSMEGYYFQDLRINEKKKQIPLVFPSIKSKNVYSFNDDETILLYVKNDTITYQNSKDLGIARTSLDLELMNNLITNNGHMMTYSVANRGDLYWVDFTDKNTLVDKQRIWYKNIPEFRTRWRYPLIKSLNDQSSLKLEPTAMLVYGRKFENRFNKFALVDSNKYELSEDNIFQSNRFSGIDYHDYGTRVSYGINSSLISNHIYVDTFLGQLIHKDNVSQSGNSEYVGNATVDLEDTFEVFYRFRRNKKLKPIRNEIGATSRTEKFNTTATFTELHNLSRYFAKDDFKFEQEKISQLNFDTNYQLKKDLWIGAGARLDISGNNPKILVRSIKVTYLFDCVSISGTITDNFLHDSLRGVRKNKDKNIHDWSKSYKYVEMNISMKKLISIIIILLSKSVFASLPDIIALVNDQPITRYDFEARKKMVIVLNNIDNSNPSIDTQLNNGVMNVLIEEELLNQYATTVGGKITAAQVDNAISTIEQRNNMPKGGMVTFMKERGLQIESFRKQITSELIKHNIISSLSNSVSVSPLEIDVAIVNTDMPKFNVEAWVFTSKGSDNKYHKQMQDLKKRLYDCNKVDQKLYDNFAEAEKFDKKLDDISASTKSIIQDTKLGSTSSIYKEDGKFKLVFVCKKESTVSSGDLSKLKTFLSNKKMSQKATKFLKDLKAKAYIKIMI